MTCHWIVIIFICLLHLLQTLNLIIFSLSLSLSLLKKLQTWTQTTRGETSLLQTDVDNYSEKKALEILLKHREWSQNKTFGTRGVMAHCTLEEEVSQFSNHSLETRRLECKCEFLREEVEELQELLRRPSRGHCKHSPFSFEEKDPSSLSSDYDALPHPYEWGCWERRNWERDWTQETNEKKFIPSSLFMSMSCSFSCASFFPFRCLFLIESSFGS